MFYRLFNFVFKILNFCKHTLAIFLLPFSVIFFLASANDFYELSAGLPGNYIYAPFFMFSVILIPAIGALVIAKNLLTTKKPAC